jgi:hypothetical protein
MNKIKIKKKKKYGSRLAPLFAACCYSQELNLFPLEMAQY